MAKRKKAEVQSQIGTKAAVGLSLFLIVFPDPATTALGLIGMATVLGVQAAGAGGGK